MEGVGRSSDASEPSQGANARENEMPSAFRYARLALQ
jgi:hypothetical protein